jgi:uncharacterized protein YidB (DUF937 family)
MGLLDGILSNVLGGALGGATGSFDRQSDSPLGSVLDRLGGGSGVTKVAFLGLAFQLLQRAGGIDGLLEKLREAGLGAHGDSWVGTGQNMPVLPDQLRQALGPDVLGQLASQFGLSHDAPRATSQRRHGRRRARPARPAQQALSPAGRCAPRAASARSSRRRRRSKCR